MIKYADGGELQDSDLRDIVLKSFKDEEGFDLGYESGRSYRYKSEDHTAKKSVNYNGEDYTVEFRVKVMYEAEGAATIEELTVDGIDVDLELFSKDDREEVETFFDDMSENIGQGYAKGGKVQKRPRFDNLDYADGGEVKWQDAKIGDSARVKSENKMGVIKKDYGRKFHLKFVDGTEKTYDASELEFIKDEYADGGELEWGEDLGDGFSVGTDVIITNSGKTGFISGLSGKDLLVTISEDGEDMSVVVSKKGVEMLDAPEYAKGGMFATGITSKKEILKQIKLLRSTKESQKELEEELKSDNISDYEIDLIENRKLPQLYEDEAYLYNNLKFLIKKYNIEHDKQVSIDKNLYDFLKTQGFSKGGSIQKRPRFDNLMADGGVTYVAPNDNDQKYFRRFDDAIGSFAWIYNKKYNEGILYPLTDFDKDYYSHIKLKDGEVLLRYKTDRMMSKYLIKINLDKSLVYFLSEDGDDDKNPTFESRGIQADYITLTNNYK